MLSANSPPHDHISHSRRSRSLDIEHGSHSTAKDELQNVVTSEDEFGSPLTKTSTQRRQLSRSTDITATKFDLDPEFLKDLRRRSLLYAPQRSSSLTAPPKTPLDDEGNELIISSIKSIKVSGGNRSEAILSSGRTWREWLMGIINGWKTLIFSPQLGEESLDEEIDGAHKDDHENANLLADSTNSDEITDTHEYNHGNISHLDGTTSEILVPSPRYGTPLSNVWTWRSAPIWDAGVHPTVVGLRYLRDEAGGRHETALDVGCELLGGPSIFGAAIGEPFPDRIADEEMRRRNLNIYDGADDGLAAATCNGDCCDTHTENAKPSATTNEQPNTPLLEGEEDNSLNDGCAFGAIGDPPSSPRPSRRALSFIAQAALTTERINEIVARTQAQELANADLLMDLRMARTFDDPSRTESRTSNYDDDKQADATETNGQRVSSADIDSNQVVGEGDLTIAAAIGNPKPDRVEDSVEDSPAAV